MNKNITSFYKQRLTVSDFKLLSDHSDKFTNIEKIAMNLYRYIPEDIPSENGFTCLVAEIITISLRAYDSTKASAGEKYQAFLFELISQLKKLLMFGVSNANKNNEHSRGVYWDCLKEPYSEWSKRNKVNTPLVERLSINIDGQSLAIGMVLVSFVIDRSDWSFIGVPQTGMSEHSGSNVIDNFILQSKVA